MHQFLGELVWRTLTVSVRRWALLSLFPLLLSLPTLAGVFLMVTDMREHALYLAFFVLLGFSAYQCVAFGCLVGLSAPIVLNEIEGRPRRHGTVIVAALRRFPACLGASALSFGPLVFILYGASFLQARFESALVSWLVIVLGLVFLMRSLLAPVVAVIERDASPGRALRRSAALTRRSRWAILLGIVVVTVLIVVVQLLVIESFRWSTVLENRFAVGIWAVVYQVLVLIPLYVLPAVAYHITTRSAEGASSQELREIFE